MSSRSRSRRRAAQQDRGRPAPEGLESQAEVEPAEQLASVEGGQVGPVPYKDELAAFFGADLADFEAVTGVGDALASIGAGAAQSQNRLYFADANPSKEQVVEEVAHGLQAPVGRPTGLTSPGEGAEREANQASADFAAGQERAGALEQTPSGVARDDEEKSTLEQLREAADGNWIGNVDEALCLRLIGELSAGDKVTVCNDKELMRKLAGAFNASEIMQCVRALPFVLVWQAYWIRTAGEEGNVGAEAWAGLLADAPVDQRVSLVTWSSYEQVKEHIGQSLPEIFADAVADGTWGGLLAGNAALAQALANSLGASELLQEVGSELIDAGDIAGIVTAMGSAWTAKVSALPTGSGLSAEDRVALRRVAGELELAQVTPLFERRFNASTEGRTEGADGNTAASTDADAVEIAWTKEDLLAVWDVLDVLPDQDVADNTVIRAYQAISGNRGFYSGPMANQERSGTIKLGQGLRTSSDPERLPHTVMHEVGHAVHRRINGVVNAWLEKEVKFWYYAEGASGWTSLISDLGGWPTTYEDFSANEVDFGQAEKDRVLELLDAHGGDQSWTEAAPMPDVSSVVPTEGAHGPITQDQEDALLWRAMPLDLRECLRLSTPKWYKRYSSLPSGPKGRYFFNHWYHQPFYFSSTAEAAISATGENYSAMSHKEFFANCYAEFFHDPAGYSDHSKWGGSLNAPVEAFMRNHVLDRQPYTPPGEGGDSDTTTNPAESDGTPV